MKRIVIFGSGSGTNAERIAQYFSDSKNIKVSNFFTNNPDAFIIKRAEKLNIPCIIFSKQEFYHTDYILNFLKKENPDLIVLAGFLWLFPSKIIHCFQNKVVNIHPALLPKYGGKGMYGENVHKAVIENKEKESGITIHYVNEKYDEGTIISQKTCKIEATDTPDSLAGKIHELEYKYFPVVIEQMLL